MTTTAFSGHILGPDTHANRPDAATVPYSAIYMCSDHDLVYYNNAGTWGTYIDVTGGTHASAHEDGGGDELEVTDLATSESDDTLVLAPDGAGGVEFRAEAGGGSAHVSDTASRTSGNITLNNAGSFADVDNNLDLTVAAAEGDRLLIFGQFVTGNTAVQVGFDAATIVSASPVNYVSGGAGFGVGSWFAPASVAMGKGGTIMYTVVSGDISSGDVTLRLRYKSSASTDKLLYADGTNWTLQWSVVNIGQ